MKTLAANLKTYRVHRGLTPKKLAALAHIGVATVYNVERGDSPSVATLEALASALGVHPADLLADPSTSSLRRCQPPSKRTTLTGIKSGVR